MSYIKPNSKYEIFVKNIAIKQRFDKLMIKSVNITPEQVSKCIDFAKESVERFDDYIKLVPKDIKDVNLQKEIGMQRIFIDKISECAFINYLINKGIDENAISKYKIGIKTAIAKEIHTRLIIDKNEFESKNNKKNYYVGIHLNLEMEDKKYKIGIKTAIAKEIHTRLIIDKNEFESKNNKKNYYVGIHLNLEMEDKKYSIKRHLVKDLYSIEKVQIFGYLDEKFVKELRYETIKNKFGKKEFKFYTKKASDYKEKKEYARLIETECKWYYLDRLMPIDNLAKKIK